MFAGRLLFFYIFARHLWTLAAVLGGLSGIVVLGQFGDMSRYLSELPGWSALATLRIALLRTPILLQAILPHVALISSALVLIRLGRRMELAVMMQNGLSPARILMPVVLGAALAGAAFAFAVNPWAARLNARAEQVLRAVAGEVSDPSHRSPRQMVLARPDGALYVLIEHVPPDPRLIYGVSIYRVDRDKTLVETVEAPRALRRGPESWQLLDPRRLYLAPGQPEEGGIGEMLRIDPGAFAEVPRDPQAIGIDRLGQAIRLAETTGAPSAPLRLRLAWLLALPGLLGAVAWLGGAIVVRPLHRSVWRGDAGMVLGAAFVIYTVSAVFEALGARGLVPPALAVSVLPSAAVLGGGVILHLKAGGNRMLRHRRRRAGRASAAPPSR